MERIKAWRVSDGECSIYCRAETRNKARDCWPESPSCFEDVMALRVTREPRFDGPTPMSYIDTVEVRCECREREALIDDYSEYGCGLCWEGMRIDWDATVAMLAELDRTAA